MKKKIILGLLIVFLSGCSKEVLEYKKVSDALIQFYNEGSYDDKNLSTKQIGLLDNYLNNKAICLDDYIIKDSSFMTNEGNTKGVYLNGGKCYINSQDIVFVKSTDHNIEDTARIVCNGYFVTLTKDSISPNTDNIRYDYRFLGYFKSDEYSFGYRSYYDGSSIIITVGDTIKVDYANVDNLDLEPINNGIGSQLILIVVAVVIGLGLILIVKKIKENNDL